MEDPNDGPAAAIGVLLLIAWAVAPLLLFYMGLARRQGLRRLPWLVGGALYVLLLMVFPLQAGMSVEPGRGTLCMGTSVGPVECRQLDVGSSSKAGP